MLKYFLILLLIFNLPVFASVSNKVAKKPIEVVAEDPRTDSPERTYDDSTAMTVTGELLKEALNLLKNPYVLQVRKDFDKYVSGGFKDQKDLLLIKGTQKNGTDGMDSFGPKYFKGPFIVIQ